MTPDTIRGHPPSVLTQAQREACFETGFLVAEGLIPDAWLQRLNALSDAPDVKFHGSRLNCKWPGTGEIVQWHQDIPAWPHTNRSPATVAHLDPTPSPVPPDWSKLGYGSIFVAQKTEL